MATTMIPSTITATLSADLSYNPNVHVQTVEIDRTGAQLLAEHTNNFVKWYLKISDFKKLLWNTRDMGSDGPLGTDSGVDIFAFARESTNPVYTTSDDPAWSWTSLAQVDTNPEHADTSGVVLTEATGGGVKFQETTMSFYVPLVSSSNAPGTAGAGEGAYVGGSGELVTYDRATLTSDASGSLDSDQTARTAVRATPSATTTTWSFDDASFQMILRWKVGQSSAETSWDASMMTWGYNKIFVTADTGVSTIAVTKPYNDAAADYIQIGIDASGSSTTYASSTSASVGNTPYGQHSFQLDGVTLNTDGLVDPLAAGMDTASADVVTSSVDFAAYFSDYTANTAVDTKRNYIAVDIGTPTLKVSNSVLTESLQEAINKDGTSRNVSDTAQLRAAAGAAFTAGHLEGFQASVPTTSTCNDYHAAKVELPLPFEIAAQQRKVSAQTTTSATSALNTDESGGEDKKVWLTPIIKIVEDTYSHGSWYSN